MSGFFGTWENKIDGKGRVSIPSDFRGQISGGEIFLFASPEAGFPAVFGCPVHILSTMTSLQDELEESIDDAARLIPMIFARSRKFGIDDTGRIVLPQELIAKAELDGKAEFVGQGQHFEIWLPGGFEKHLEAGAASNTRKFLKKVARQS